MMRGSLFSLAKDCTCRKPKQQEQKRKASNQPPPRQSKHYDYGHSISLAYDGTYYRMPGQEQDLVGSRQSAQKQHFVAAHSLDEGFSGDFWAEPFEAAETEGAIDEPQIIAAPLGGSLSPVKEEPSRAVLKPPAVQPQRQAEEMRHETNAAYAPRVTLGDDEFMSDLRAILRGDKAFDEDKKQVLPKQEVQRPAPPTPGNYREEETLTTKPAPGKDIFEKIAQNMHYANAYDLGSFALEQRFDEFDKGMEADQKAEAMRIQKADKGLLEQLDQQQSEKDSQPETVLDAPPVSISDFLSDLDAIKALTEPEKKEEEPPLVIEPPTDVVNAKESTM